MAGDLIQGEVEGLLKRGITDETCAHFGYKVGTYRGEKVHIAPYYRDGKLVAQHLRTKAKDFPWLGAVDGIELFGQHLWRDSGKMVVVTEGEIDAMSVSQIQGNKWPVVSLPNGAQSAVKHIKHNLQWLEKFDTVVLMFDNDEPGKEAAQECAPLFSPGKVKIAALPLKDANDMLKAKRQSEVIDAIWGAKEWRPEGLLTVADVAEQVMATLPEGAPWCFDGLNALTYGRRPGEVLAFGAGTGVGKTDLFTQQIAFDVQTLGVRCGLVYLEQPPAETVRRIAGKLRGRVFHVPGYDPAELKAAVEELKQDNKLVMFDHFGATDWELVKGQMRYMVVSLGCKHIYLDHLTALVAGEEDEKKALDAIMAELAGMAKALGCIVHFISHLATPEGKPHEEGGRVTIRHFRGSRSIGFWSHFMFGLERNQQAEDEAARSITTLRCLKDRVTGRGTGKTLNLRYSHDTGLLSETDDEVPFGNVEDQREEF